jgi:two-component SAPR family response regulator
VVEDRERLRIQAAGLAAEAARTALEHDEAADAERLARRSIEIDPYHDPSWEVLITALDRLGDRAAAEVARRDHRRFLAELGLIDEAPLSPRSPGRDGRREPASMR